MLATPRWRWASRWWRKTSWNAPCATPTAATSLWWPTTRGKPWRCPGSRWTQKSRRNVSERPRYAGRCGWKRRAGWNKPEPRTVLFQVREENRAAGYGLVLLKQYQRLCEYERTLRAFDASVHGSDLQLSVVFIPCPP